MHSRILLAFCVVAGLSCGGSDRASAPAQSTADVYTPGNIFSPPTAGPISVGGTVFFHITKAADGMGHNVLFRHSVAGAPADIPVVADTVVSRQFNTRGTFAYDCLVHPGMTGEVVVQ
jgi:plastocyanin